MSARERFLVHSQVADRFGFSSRQSAGHRAFLNGMHFVPAQMQLIAHGFLTGCFHPVDGQPLKHRGKSARRFGPGKVHTARAMFRAVDARRLGMQDCPVLGGVQMPPAPLRLMIVQGTWLAACRARPRKTLVVLQSHVHFALVQFQLNAIHAPWLSNTQNLGVQVSVLHSPIIGPVPLKSPMSQKYRLWSFTGTHQYRECGRVMAFTVDLSTKAPDMLALEQDRYGQANVGLVSAVVGF